jgi:hypothetical protein
MKSKEEPASISSTDIVSPIVENIADVPSVHILKRKGGKKGRKIAAQKQQIIISLDGKLIT